MARCRMSGLLTWRWFHSSGACCWQLCYRTYKGVVVSALSRCWWTFAIPSPMWKTQYQGTILRVENACGIWVCVCHSRGEMGCWCKHNCTLFLLWCLYVKCLRICTNGTRVTHDSDCARYCRHVFSKRLRMRCRMIAIVHGWIISVLRMLRLYIIVYRHVFWALYLWNMLAVSDNMRKIWETMPVIAAVCFFWSEFHISEWYTYRRR